MRLISEGLQHLQNLRLLFVFVCGGGITLYRQMVPCPFCLDTSLVFSLS
jgi:hypothetical protein